jgi:hypothetical protein
MEKLVFLDLSHLICYLLLVAICGAFFAIA